MGSKKNRARRGNQSDAALMAAAYANPDDGNDASFDPIDKLNELISTYNGDFSAIDAEVCQHEKGLTEELQSLVFTHSPQLLNIFAAIKASLDEVQILKRTVIETKAVIGEISAAGCTSAVLAETTDALSGAAADSDASSVLSRTPFRRTAKSARHAITASCRSSLLAQSTVDGEFCMSVACLRRFHLTGSVLEQRRVATLAAANALRKNTADAVRMFDAERQGLMQWTQRRDARLLILRGAQQEVEAGNVNDAMKSLDSVAADAEPLGYLAELLQVEAELQGALRWLSSQALPDHLQPVVAPKVLDMILQVHQADTTASDAAMMASMLHLATQTKVIERCLSQVVAAADRSSYSQTAAQEMVRIILESIDEHQELLARDGSAAAATATTNAGALSSIAQWIAARIHYLDSKIVSPHLRTVAESAILTNLSLSETRLMPEGRFLLRAASFFPDTSCIPLVAAVSDAIATCAALLPLEERGFPNSAAKLARGIIKRVVIPTLNRCVGTAQEASEAWSLKVTKSSALIAVHEAIITGEIPPAALSQLYAAPHGSLLPQFAASLHHANDQIRDAAARLSAVAPLTPELRRLITTLFPTHHFSHLPAPEDLGRRQNPPPTSTISAAFDVKLVRRAIQQGQKNCPIVSPFSARMLGTVSAVCVVILHLSQMLRHPDPSHVSVARTFVEDAHLSEVFDTSLQQLFRSWFFVLDEFSTQVFGKMQQVVAAQRVNEESPIKTATLADILEDQWEERHFLLVVANAVLQDLLCAQHLLEAVRKMCIQCLPDSVHLDALHKRLGNFVSNVVRQTYLTIDDVVSDSSDDDDDESSDEGDDDDSTEMKLVEALVNAQYVAPKALAGAVEGRGFLVASVLARYPPFRFANVDADDEGYLFHLAAQVSLNLVTFIQHMTFGGGKQQQQPATSSPLTPSTGGLGGSSFDHEALAAAGLLHFGEMVAAAAFGGGLGLCSNTPSYIAEAICATKRYGDSSTPKGGLSVALLLTREILLTMLEQFFCDEEYWTAAYALADEAASAPIAGSARRVVKKRDPLPLNLANWRQIVLFLAIMVTTWKPLFQGDDAMSVAVTAFLGNVAIPGSSQPVLTIYNDLATPKKVAKLMAVNMKTFETLNEIQDADDEDDDEAENVSASTVSLADLTYLIHMLLI